MSKFWTPFPYIFGKKAVKSFFNIIKATKKKFLITLDGFDSTFDVFRRDSFCKDEELQKKSKFEIEWLRSFLQLILRITQISNSHKSLYPHIDFCIAVPQDRFFEIIRSERDSYRYNNRFLSLKWSGIELAILLRKRLESLFQVSSNKDHSPENRLEEILLKHFKHIPRNIIFDFNSKQYQIPIFLYVLRYTFWRPRDILYYFARILSVAEEIKKKRLDVTSEVIRQTVARATSEVINSEFVNEFNTTFININDVIDKFSNGKNILNYNEIREKLLNIQFVFLDNYDNNMDVCDKIDFLYKIGFLGIYLDGYALDRMKLRHRHAFYFNEGEIPNKRSLRSGYKKYRFIIHPIFVEDLNIDTSDNELILNYSWQYLHENEALYFT